MYVSTTCNKSNMPGMWVALWSCHKALKRREWCFPNWTWMLTWQVILPLPYNPWIYYALYTADTYCNQMDGNCQESVATSDTILGYSFSLPWNKTMFNRNDYSLLIGMLHFAVVWFNKTCRRQCRPAAWAGKGCLPVVCNKWKGFCFVIHKKKSVCGGFNA